MSVLLDGNTKAIVQGITGRQGRFDTENCLRYGTKIVAGVTPGRGGEMILGIPVYNTVRAAVDERGADATVVYVPAAQVKDAILEESTPAFASSSPPPKDSRPRQRLML